MYQKEMDAVRQGMQDDEPTLPLEDEGISSVQIGDGPQIPFAEFKKNIDTYMRKITDGLGRITGNSLADHVSRIEFLESEKARISETIKVAYEKAEFAGFDVKALKQTVKIRAKPIDDEHRLTVNTYLAALNELPLFAASERH